MTQGRTTRPVIQHLQWIGREVAVSNQADLPSRATLLSDGRPVQFVYKVPPFVYCREMCTSRATNSL